MDSYKAWWRRISLFIASTWDQLIARFNSWAPSENSVLLSFAVATGLLSASGVVLFYKAIDVAYNVFYRWPAEQFPVLGLLAYRPLITAGGFLAAWWVMRRLGRGHDGMNVPDVQLAVVKRGGDVPARPAIARTAASAITIGGGGSAGSEGPVVVLGAAVGSWLARTFRFAPSRVVVLVGCGTGAAISAAFNAPLAGAFFALEEVLGTFSVASFAPVVVASVVAAVTSRAVFGNHPAFPIPEQYGYAHPLELLLAYPALGVVCGLTAVLFIRMYFKVGESEKKLRLPPYVVPLAGGALVGVIVFLSGGILVGYGHLSIHLDVFGRMTWYALLLLALGKILATSLTLNLGGSGGVFTPSLYVGAATGGGVGLLFASLFPSLHVTPEAFALVGMGAMIAGATGAPITGILLVFEMTNDYAIMIPLMLTVVITYVIARKIDPDNLYSGWLRRRGESIEQGADRDILTQLHVSDAYDPNPRSIHEATPISGLLSYLDHSQQTYFPVIDDDHHLVGVITIAALSQAAANQAALGSLIVAADIATPSERVTPQDSLLEAIRLMGVRDAASLPVVAPDSQRLIGLISRSHILNLYERRVSATSGH